MPQVLVDRADIVALKTLADKLSALPDYVGPTPVPPQPIGTVYHGVTQPQAPWVMADLDAFEAKVGNKVAIVSYFIAMEGNTHEPDTNSLAAVRARGAVPMITWEWKLSNLATINSGTYDAGARLWAQRLKAYGGPVLLRWGHEMNLQNYPWSIGVGGNTAAQYVTAWKRLKNIFGSEGASNVQWIWCPNVLGGNALDFGSMWPGATYVDWLGLDGYNWSSINPWKTFTEIFSASYNKITALTTTKPLMICEWGSTEDKGDKGAWIKNALTIEIPGMPRIKAVVYFNTSYDNANWPIESSAGAIAGYKAGIVGYKSTYP